VGGAFYGWNDESLVRISSAGKQEWSVALKDWGRQELLEASDGVIVRAGPRSGLKAPRAFQKLSAAGKALWTVAIPDADQAAMEDSKAWSVVDGSDDLVLLCGKVRGADGAIWTAIANGKAKRIVLKNLVGYAPRSTPRTDPAVMHILRRGGEWFAVASCELDKAKTAGLVVVNLSTGKEARRVPAGINAEAPPGITVSMEGDLVDVCADKPVGKFGGTISFSRSYAYIKDGPKLRWMSLADGKKGEAELQGSVGRTTGDLLAVQTREDTKTVVGTFDFARGSFEKVKTCEGQVQSWVDADDGVVLVGIAVNRVRLVVAVKKP
jgi:hypothetical protein